MKRRLRVYLFVVVVFVVVSASGIIFNQTSRLSPPILETCKTIRDNGGENNVLFFSEKVVAEDYANYFLKTEPFKSNKNNFNFFYIDSVEPQCEIYKEEAFFCYSKDLVKKSSACPNDYIVVLGDYPPKIRSSSFMNVLSLNENHPKSVFLHEFGHAFANLAEEYVELNAKIPEGSKNCVERCESFGSVGGCYNGCTLSEFFRSPPNGVMRTLSTTDYGAFNKNLIKERMEEENEFFGKYTGKVISETSDCESQNYYLIGQVEGELKKELHRGCAGSTGYGGKDYQIVSKNNEILLEGKINDRFIFTSRPSPEGESLGRTYDYEGDFFIKVPVVIRGENIEIAGDRKLVESSKEVQDRDPLKEVDVERGFKIFDINSLGKEFQNGDKFKDLSDEISFEEEFSEEINSIYLGGVKKVIFSLPLKMLEGHF